MSKSDDETRETLPMLERADEARRLIRRMEPPIRERYSMLALVVWGDKAHDVAAELAGVEPAELERRLRS